MRLAIPIGLLPALAIIACSDAGDTSSTAASDAEVAANEQPDPNSSRQGRIDTQAAETVSEEPDPPVDEARSADTVPLTPGVYVLEGTSCENPANAAFRVWDGDGLSGSATRDCRGTIVSQEGNRYTIANSCENTYDGSRTTERLSMTVTDQVHFFIGGNVFESCSTAQVPDALREMLTG